MRNNDILGKLRAIRDVLQYAEHSRTEAIRQIDRLCAELQCFEGPHEYRHQHGYAAAYASLDAGVVAIASQMQHSSLSLEYWVERLEAALKRAEKYAPELD